MLHDPLMVFHDIGLYGSAGRILCWFETKTLLDQPAGRLVQIDAAARSRDEAPADLARLDWTARIIGITDATGDLARPCATSTARAIAVSAAACARTLTTAAGSGAGQRGGA